jgi:hypothetical protein
MFIEKRTNMLDPVHSQLLKKFENRLLLVNVAAQLARVISREADAPRAKVLKINRHHRPA